jgi:hypothetical protein
VIHDPEATVIRRHSSLALRLSIATFASLIAAAASQPSLAASCTDGVDCYCDRVSDPQLLVCEDFETRGYYEDVDGAWYKSPAGNSGFRGGASAWLAKWRSTGSGNWHAGEPANPKRGTTCGYSTCGPAEYHPTNLWDGNSNATIDIQRPGDEDAEVPGLTLDSDQHDLGNQWMGWRVPRGNGGIMGEMYFNPPATEVGLTYLGGYSTNLASAVADWNGDFPGQPWKHEEWGASQSTLFQGNVGGVAGPFSPTLFGGSNCSGALAAATLSVGSADCYGGNFRVKANFDRSSQWPLGTWGCVQGHIKGLGTRSGEMRIWFNERLIFEIRNADFTQLLRDQNIDRLFPDTYYNGNGGGPGSTPSLQTFYRYQDNFHARRGPPVSCQAVGFGGPSSPPPPPPDDPPPGAPAAPILLEP